MNQTLAAVTIARNARLRKVLGFQAHMQNSVFSEGELAENDFMKISGKLAAPISLQFEIVSNEGDIAVYSHEGTSYFVTNGDIQQLEQEDNDELLSSLNLDQITKNNFERLMIYAEELEFSTENNITTISLPANGMETSFAKEFIQDIEKKDPTLTVTRLIYTLKVDENYQLLSFYTYTEITSKHEDMQSFKLCTEVKADYIPLDENEDFSIPTHIVNGAK